MAQSPEAALQSMIENLAAKTGKPLAEWVHIAQKSGLAEARRDRRACSRRTTALGTATRTSSPTRPRAPTPMSVAKGGTDLVAEMYAGPKAGAAPDLRPAGDESRGVRHGRGALAEEGVREPRAARSSSAWSSRRRRRASTSG